MLDSLDTLIAFALIFTVVSLLITIVVQIITSSLNLRGKNLAWGVAEAFQAIAPDLEATAKGRGKNLADHLLKDSLLSDRQVFSWVGKAEAVRPEELFAVLHSIAVGNRPGTPAQIEEDAVALFKSLGVPAGVFDLVAADKAQLEALNADLTAQLTALPAGPVRNRLQQMKTETEAKLANAEADTADRTTRWAAQEKTKLQSIYDKFEQWFEIGQERSQEWFTTHTRIITASLGLIAAFALQLDTIEVFRLVSSNREVRDNLVAQSKAVIDEGEKVLKDRPSVLQESLRNLLAANATNRTVAGLTNIAINTPDSTGTVRAKIRDALGLLPPAEVDRVLANFDAATDQEVEARLKGYTEEYGALAKSFDQSGFDLFPKGGWRWADEPGGRDRVFGRHFVGMFCSALLLSLGAPFWFNTLRSLASLRSSVAQNISGENEAERKNTNPDKADKLPATAAKG